MRQRNIKHLEERLAENAAFLIADPRAAKGHWHEIFAVPADTPIYLEIGCGKGKFITEMAKANPESCFIAVEGQANVMLRTMEKSTVAARPNLRLFIDFVHDLGAYFEAGELAGVYLNFSDPWPKARHEKRRLTYHGRLLNYFSVLHGTGFVAVKTDNDALFSFTLQEIEQAGLHIAEQVEDLYGLPQDRHRPWATTEYEDKFRAAGKQIHYVRIER